MHIDLYNLKKLHAAAREEYHTKKTEQAARKVHERRNAAAREIVSILPSIIAEVERLRNVEAASREASITLRTEAAGVERSDFHIEVPFDEDVAIKVADDLDAALNQTKDVTDPLASDYSHVTIDGKTWEVRKFDFATDSFHLRNGDSVVYLSNAGRDCDGPSQHRWGSFVTNTNPLPADFAARVRAVLAKAKPAGPVHELDVDGEKIELMIDRQHVTNTSVGCYYCKDGEILGYARLDGLPGDGRASQMRELVPITAARPAACYDAIRAKVRELRAAKPAPQKCDHSWTAIQYGPTHCSKCGVEMGDQTDPPAIDVEAALSEVNRWHNQHVWTVLARLISLLPALERLAAKEEG